MNTKEEVLQNCTIEGMVVKLPAQQLERKLYQEVAKSLELIGGKWKGGKVFGFVFPHDPTDLLEQVAGGETRNLKKEFQFFSTPVEVAETLVSMANIRKNDVILEPSAGSGAIMDVIIKRMFENTLLYCEMMPTNNMILQRKYAQTPNVYDLHPAFDDFLNLKGLNVADRIIANPPFANNQDINHVYKMYEILRPGGRIVTLMSTHWVNSNNRKETEFRRWMMEHESDVMKVGAGAFRESGTMIETIILTIDKP